MPVIDPSSIARAIDAAREAGREVLDEGVRTSEAYEVVAECLLREGNTVEEIAKLAKERNFELIVMGFGGASRIKELLFGNVSEGVAKHVSCPVLLVK